MPGIAVCILTFNNDSTLEKCLKSVSFADEVLVIDSGSTDDSVEIARRYQARIIQKDWPGFIGQRRFALQQAEEEWMLFLDADEEVSLKLAESINGVVLDNPTEIDGFLVNRRSFYLGRWQRQLYPDSKIALFRRTKAEICGKEPHAEVAVSGKIEKLPGDILHYPYDNITHHINKINYMSSVAAQSYMEKGKSAGMLYVLFRVFWEFIKKYIVKGGIRDGASGFMVTILSCFSVFVKYAKLWENQTTSLDA